MARLPRLYAPGVVQYLLQRPASGRTFFPDADGYAFFVDLLASTTRAEAVALHAYVLLPGELRLLATPPDAGALGRTMQALGRRYAPYLNRRTGRAGALWDRRFRSTLIDAGTLLLPAMRHIESRPRVDGLADALERWRWSSYLHHAGLAQQPFVVDHAGYWALSDTPFARQAAYREFVASADRPVDRVLEQAVDRGWAAGPAAWLATLGEATNRRVAPLARGRPRSGPSLIRNASQEAAE